MQWGQRRILFAMLHITNTNKLQMPPGNLSVCHTCTATRCSAWLTREKSVVAQTQRSQERRLLCANFWLRVLVKRVLVKRVLVKRVFSALLCSNSSSSLQLLASNFTAADARLRICAKLEFPVCWRPLSVALDLQANMRYGCTWHVAALLPGQCEL